MIHLKRWVLLGVLTRNPYIQPVLEITTNRMTKIYK